MDIDKTPKDKEQVTGEISDKELENVAGGTVTPIYSLPVGLEGDPGALRLVKPTGTPPRKLP